MGDDAKLIMYDEETKMQERVFHARSVVFINTFVISLALTIEVTVVDGGEEYFVRFVKRLKLR